MSVNSWQLQEFWKEQLRKLRCLENFEFYVSSERYLMFQRETINRRLIIGVGDLFKMKMHSIGSSITLKSIESYFHNLDQTPKNEWRQTITQRWHTMITGHEFGIGTYDKLPLNIKSEEDVLKGIKLIEQYYENDALPFFDYWNDVTSFLPFLELDYDDTMGLHHVFGQSMTLKKCIVWYLTSHPEYTDYLNYHLAQFKVRIKEDPKNKELKEAYGLFLSIINRLEKSDVMFEWNPEYLKRREV